MHYSHKILLLIGVISFCVSEIGLAQNNSGNPQETPAPQEKPAPREKPAPQLNSPNLPVWQALLEKFYQNDVKMKLKMIPIFTRQPEIKILKKYLPELYTPTLCQWFFNYFQNYIGDPHFPTGAVKIGRIETESADKAILAIAVYGAKQISKQQSWQYYRISLAKEGGAWVVDKEEIIAKMTIANNSISLLERTAFGHLYMPKIANVDPPVFHQNDPEQLRQSLWQLARYLSNERNKLIAQILPELVGSMQSLVSKNYYERLQKHLQPASKYVQLAVQKFAAAEKSPFTKSAPNSPCWELRMTSQVMPEGDKAEHLYYICLQQEADIYKFHLEATDKEEILPLLAILFAVQLD